MVQNPPAKPGDIMRHGFDLLVGKVPWRKAWQPTLVFLPGESQRQRSLAGYSSWGCKRVGHNLATKQQQWQFQHFNKFSPAWWLQDFFENHWKYMRKKDLGHTVCWRKHLLLSPHSQLLSSFSPAVSMAILISNLPLCFSSPLPSLKSKFKDLNLSHLSHKFTD